MKICSELNCGRPVCAVGLCRTHYRQHLHGKVLTPINPARATAKPASECSVRRCGRYGNVRGLCAMHRERLRKTGDINSGRMWSPRLSECIIVDCHEPFKKRNLCERHYARAKRFSLTDLQLSQILLDAKCAACGSIDELQIDHDHTCCPGRQSCGHCIRGILCAPCNWILGNANDSVDRLQRLIDYLAP